MKQYSLSIYEIREEANSAITISFKQPNLRKIKYQAGQYITLIVRVNGRRYARPYSFSSAPSVDSLLEVTVKRVQGGIVSNYINTELKVGDIIEVLEPMGDFTYNFSNPPKQIYFWGVGSGITPLFSIIKELLITQKNIGIYLIYGNKNLKSMIFNKQLLQLQKDYPLNFFIINFFSQIELTEPNNTFQKGRISSEFIKNLLAQNLNLNESAHYICGPNGLKNMITSTLQELNVPASFIFAEEFELVVNPLDLDDLVDSKVNIVFQNELSEIIVPKGKNVLDIALDHGIEIPYSCQTGNCNTCKAKLKKGKLKMLGLSKERLDLTKDEFLLCCSFPLTDMVEIELIK
jgi:ring-1,2-phenylacetyl-CoA epoxidase subunit PaaE